MVTSIRQRRARLVSHQRPPTAKQKSLSIAGGHTTLRDDAAAAASAVMDSDELVTNVKAAETKLLVTVV